MGGEIIRIFYGSGGMIHLSSGWELGDSWGWVGRVGVCQWMRVETRDGER